MTDIRSFYYLVSLYKCILTVFCVQQHRHVKLDNLVKVYLGRGIFRRFRYRLCEWTRLNIGKSTGKYSLLIREHNPNA